MYRIPVVFFFFFQAEDGIRDTSVTGVQTCALPIFSASAAKASSNGDRFKECETASVTPPTDAILPSDLYLITVAHAEGYCGEEDVYGKLCEEEIGRASCRERG